MMNKKLTDEEKKDHIARCEFCQMGIAKRKLAYRLVKNLSRKSIQVLILSKGIAHVL